MTGRINRFRGSAHGSKALPQPRPDHKGELPICEVKTPRLSRRSARERIQHVYVVGGRVD